MSAHMKKHHINKIMEDKVSLFVLHNGNGELYKVPTTIYKNLSKYIVVDVKQKKVAYELLLQLRWNTAVEADEVFNKVNLKYGKIGAIVRGIRIRENLSQKEFSSKINISQSDLSKIENGKRAIGKIILARIVKKFKVNREIFQV